MKQLKHLQELAQLQEAVGGGFFAEAKGYSDSSEFTDEFYDLFTQVTKMKKVMKNPKWLEYMKLTDFNMETSTEDNARDAIKAIVALEAALNEIDREFDRANGHEEDDTYGDGVGGPAVDSDDELPNYDDEPVRKGMPRGR